MAEAAALSASLASDAVVRASGEAQLALWHRDGGSRALAILGLAAESHGDEAVRLAAAIAFKRWVAKAWRTETKGDVAPAKDDVKAAVRAVMFEAVAGTQGRVRAQLAEAWKHILAADFPEEVGGAAGFAANIGQALAAAVQSNDVGRAHALLLATRYVLRRYEYKEPDTKNGITGPLVHAVLTDAALPVLDSLTNVVAQWASSSAAQPLNPPDAPDMLKLALKSFASATYLSFPEVLAGPLATDAPIPAKQIAALDKNLVPATRWLDAVLRLLATPPPPPAALVGPHLANDRAAWEGHPYWKTLKRCLLIVNRMFGRYCDPDMLKQKPSKREDVVEYNLNHFLMHNYYELFQRAVFRMLERAPHAAQGAISRRCLNVGVSFVAEAVTAMKSKVIAKALKPHIETLIAHVAFPLLDFDQEDEDLWCVLSLPPTSPPLRDLITKCSVHLFLAMAVAKNGRGPRAKQQLSFRTPAFRTATDAPQLYHGCTKTHPQPNTIQA